MTIIHPAVAKTADVMVDIREQLIGKLFRAVQRRENDWVFTFSNNASVGVEASWRIIAEGRNQFGDGDHGHQFGLPAPIDGESLVHELLSGKAVRAIDIREDTGDLILTFDNGTKLEVVHISAGYEGWQLTTGTLNVVAQGGGQLAIWRT